MKNMLKYIAILGLGIVFPPLTISTPNEDETVAGDFQLPNLQVTGISSLPIPIKQSMPRVGKALVGTTVVMKFTVDRRGRLHSVRSAKPLAGIFDDRVRDLAVLLGQTLRGWKFNPALNANGLPVAAKILMPVKIVDRSGEQVALASLMLDVPESGGL